MIFLLSEVHGRIFRGVAGFSEICLLTSGLFNYSVCSPIKEIPAAALSLSLSVHTPHLLLPAPWLSAAVPTILAVRSFGLGLV